jgi:alpha-glucosidase
MQAFCNHDAVRSVSNLMDFAVREGRAPEAARMLLFLQCCLRGGALIYQGEELGLTHPKLAREEIRDPWGQALWPDFEGRDGARTPMPWVADDPHGGFTDGDAPWMAAREEHLEIAADRQRADPGSVLSFLRHLLAWRRSQPAVCWGDERIRTGNKAPLIVWDRSLEGDALRFVVNFSLDQRLLPIDDDDRGPIQDAPMAVAEQTETGVQLAPLGFCVLNAPR